ncbi:MAG: hypothetical protein KTR31_08545 [Myxococcales bacterium]|nr:hypothetical protein [Myxococcales bacterium]
MEPAPTTAGQEVPEAPVSLDKASDPPLFLTLIVTVGAFAAVTWGLMALFRDRSPPPPAVPEAPPDGD